MEILGYIDMHFLFGLTLILGVFCLFYYSAVQKQTQAMNKVDLLLKQLESINHHMGVMLHEQRSCNRLLSEGTNNNYVAFMPQEPYPSATHLNAPLEMLEPSASNKLYVGNIDYAATETELEHHFAQFGQIEFVNIPVNRYTGRARGFGFVTFAAHQDAERAMTLNGSEFKGRPIQVNFAKDRDAVS